MLKLCNCRYGIVSGFFLFTRLWKLVINFHRIGDMYTVAEYRFYRFHSYKVLFRIMCLSAIKLLKKIKSENIQCLPRIIKSSKVELLSFCYWSLQYLLIVIYNVCICRSSPYVILQKTVSNKGVRLLDKRYEIASRTFSPLIRFHH